MSPSKANMMSHIMLWLGLVGAIPGSFWLFKPHLADFVQEIVRKESNALKYEWTSENLQTFMNIPESQRNDFHRSEISRLEAKRALLLQKLGADYRGD